MDLPFPPPGTTDCHTHVAGPRERYPMVSPRAFTPKPATPETMRAMMDRVGSDRIVLVQFSVYGTDNTCMLDGLKTLGDCARGVAVPPADMAGGDLDAMHAQGVRGIRVNLNTTGLNDPALARERLATTVRQCERNGWHIQLFTTPAVISALEADLTGLPVPVVFDHFGLLSPVERGGNTEAIIRSLLESGRGWVKVSGTYRLSDPNAKVAIRGLARDLYQANPDRIVWGSDWPHSPHHAGVAEADPAELPYRDIDPADMLDTIRQWFDDPAEWRRILVDNPARLYDFPSS